MPRQNKATTPALEPSVVNKKTKQAKDFSGKRPDYLVWAWEFLRRNHEYRLLYRIRFDSTITANERVSVLWSDPAARTLPIELFDVEPEPKYGDNFGLWMDRVDSQNLNCSIDIRDIFFDPRRYCLASWVNPNIKLPNPIETIFDKSVFELDEVWAINFKSKEQNDEFRLLGPSPRNFQCGLGMTATKPTQVALKFDLRLPLESQLAQAESQLKNAVEIYKENTHKNWHQIPEWTFKVNRQDSWTDMLDLLDLLPESSSNVDLFRRFKRNPDLAAFDADAKALETLLKKAKWLRDIGYRAILLKGLGNTPSPNWKMKKKPWTISRSSLAQQQ